MKVVARQAEHGKTDYQPAYQKWSARARAAGAVVLFSGALASFVFVAAPPAAATQDLHQDLCDAANDCDDHDPCNGFESCQFGHCVAGPAPDCDDNNVCTDDYCMPRQGCRHDPNAAHCSDGNVCNGNEVCRGRTCRAGTPLRCADGIDCTIDTCDPQFGCRYAPRDGGPCRDFDDCVAEGQCVAGECIGEPACDPECEFCEDGACVPRCPGGSGERNAPTASDALLILQVAVADEDCELCVCDLDRDGEVSSTDALLALRVAVGQGVDLICPVPSTTSTSTTTSTTVTTTTTTTSNPTPTTTTTVPALPF